MFTKGLTGMKQKPEIYGLTGGSGSGKSSAADILKEKGFFVIDADITAREILNGDVLEKLRINFGNSVINSDGTLNRKALAKIVFADNDKLSLLNSITHPEIARSIIKTIEMHSPNKVIIDAAALLACKPLMDICNKIIVVCANKEIRISRIMKRDRLTYEEAESRINSQMTDEEMIKYADIVWRNDGTIQNLRSTISDCFG